MKKFELTDEADVLAEKFVVEHDCPEDGYGRIEYVFSHSSGIGVSVKARCECGQSLDLTDYGSW